MQIEDSFELDFSFTQEEVDQFAQISGDNNPIHIDPEYAAGTVFKKPIIHGFLAGSVFSKIFGTLYPGQGTVYRKQSLEFKRPMYVDTEYQAVVTVKDTRAQHHWALIETRILELETSKPTILGTAEVVNQEKIG